jgi:hypothetical protein
MKSRERLVIETGVLQPPSRCSEHKDHSLPYLSLRYLHSDHMAASVLPAFPSTSLAPVDNYRGAVVEVR